MKSIDLNCDMGEGIGNDAAIMPFISSANVACGFHAGNYTTMFETIQLAIKHGVSIGAHPSYPDQENFGRTNLNLSGKEIYELVTYQLGAIAAVSHALNARLNHVKPHGALYNMAAKRNSIAEAIVTAVKDFDSSLIFFGLSGSVMINVANQYGLRAKNEVFADRTYQDDGSLTPRTLPDALLQNVADAIRQVKSMVNENAVMSVNNKKLSIQVDTVCVHGDGEHAVEFVKALNKAFHESGIKISSQ